MKAGDLVKIKMIGVEKEPGTGIVIGFRPRGWSRNPEPDNEVWNDAIVYWSGWGVSYHMIALLEIVNVT
jgi:hypothetical protein